MRCWNVEQRTIFRSFQEMLDFFQSFEDERAVLDLAAIMKELNFGVIFFVKDEITKSCEYIDKALRLITSNPELCDSMKLKSYLGLSTNGDCGIVPRVQRDSIKTITIPCGQSVDSFVKSCVFEADKPKQMANNIHWTKYLMISIQDPLVESIISIMHHL